jgi:cytochrome c-type biogenesis protein CcmH
MVAAWLYPSICHFLLSLAVLASTLAVAPPPDAAALEREARQIETMLIAPCCWSQPVSQHQSQASEDVKQEIRALLAAGKSRQQVLDAFVEQYGQRILVEPRVSGFGLVLYGGLALSFLLTGMMFVAWVRRARRRPAAAAAAIAVGGTPDDAAYAARLDDELRDMD